MESVKRESVKREFKNAMRGESAKVAIGELKQGFDIFGLTKGQFSMIDIITHCLNEAGDSDLKIGTWTVAHADIKQAEKFILNNKIKSIKFLVDRSFPARRPKYFAKLRETFGNDCVRLANFHAKFVTIRNENWNIAVRTSMNLNLNARIENYEISDCKQICDYLDTIVSEHFKKPLEDSWDTFKSLQIDTKQSNLNFTENSKPQARLVGVGLRGA